MARLRNLRDKMNLRLIRKNVELEKILAGHKKLLKAIGGL